MAFPQSAVQLQQKPRRLQQKVFATLLIILLLVPRKEGIPMNFDPFRGLSTANLLLYGHQGPMQDMVRMRAPTFFTLVRWYKRNTALSSSKGVCLEEKVLIFLYIVGQGVTHRLAGFTFGHSPATISRLVNVFISRYLADFIK
jgi:hypothetical protein